MTDLEKCKQELEDVLKKYAHRLTWDDFCGFEIEPVDPKTGRRTWAPGTVINPNPVWKP
jgi:hypothetical protein